MLQVAAVAPHHTHDFQLHLVDAVTGHEQALAVEIQKKQNAAGCITGSEHSRQITLQDNIQPATCGLKLQAKPEHQEPPEANGRLTAADVHGPAKAGNWRVSLKA